MAEQGNADSQGSTTDQRPGNTRPFFSTVSPNGSRPSSLDLERSDSLPTGVSQSSSDQGKKNGFPAANATPEAVASTAQAAAHSEDDGNGNPDGAATTTPVTVTPTTQAAAHSEDDGNGHPDGAVTTTPAAVTPTTQAAAPQVEKPPDENGHPVGGGSDGVQAAQNNSSEGAPFNSAQEDTAPTLQPANSCLIVGAGTASLASSVPSPARQNGQNGSSGNSCELTNNRSPVPETSGQKYLAHKDQNISKMIPLHECYIKVQRDRLRCRYKGYATCAQGEHKAEVEVMIEPDLTNINPSGGYSRKGRATFGVRVLQMNQNHTYEVSIPSVFLVDPIAGALNEPVEAKDKKFQIPQGRDIVTFDIDLGPGLLEKIEKCTSTELEFQFKIKLHLEMIYTLHDLYIPSIGSSYGNIVLNNNS